MAILKSGLKQKLKRRLIRINNYNRGVSLAPRNNGGVSDGVVSVD